MIHNNVRNIRKQLHISQQKLGEELGVSRQTINAIETGKYNPSLELALLMIEYFNVEMKELFYLVKEEHQ
ncbi:helix-turn-helix transcriptional regulator [Isobaculum melis]|uniref:Transcriptional regulator, XRE family n=1 Tax=Isobaculum melis TaxID=142588 RepID=A0A1H9PVG0_9LACT|nr:helix-turn-helix transcriptional regulator [Isobaculum melis]SER52266.1 transcriptional regulator, XRE family [Isobaculum melis]